MARLQRKILLVEDSKSYQHIFGAALTDSEYQLLICETGQQAMTLIRDQYIDFVCSSYYLKDMEGIELCRALRALTKNAFKPFVLLTSVDSDDLLKVALPSGVTDIFQKRDIAQLLAYIKRFPFQGQRSSGRVLYLEDTQSQRDLIQSMLTRRGLHVDAFASADMAWPHFMNHDYDLVLTDIVLDGMMSGLNFVNLIRRQLGAKGDIPVLSITAFDDRTRRLQLFNLGITDYIIKPVIEEELFVRINNLLLKQNALKLMAHYDVLTRLPNRSLFMEQFASALSDAQKRQQRLAVCYLDLDGFKEVNDQYGRDTGDRLLIEVAKRIQNGLRPLDSLSRQGGDEFALLLRDLESVDQCETMLRQLLNRIAGPYVIDELTISIGASCGYTIYPADDADPDILLRHADQAMYQAKLGGRNHYNRFDTSYDLARQTRRKQILAIKQGLQRGEFCLYYQPKIDLLGNRVFGMEALIRWHHPQQGLKLPMDFLPPIEGTELEIELGNWVVESALHQISAWNASGLDLEVSVNIAPHHFQAPYFFQQLSQSIKRFPLIQPVQFQIEILETSVLQDLPKVTGILKACREQLGIRIALDDFGTGYSSLSHLRHLPIHSVKIDRSFVHDMTDDVNDHAIVEGVISLARAFKLEVIAEGVETAEHRLALLRLGCDKAQGYGIAKPMPASSVADWVRRYSHTK